MQLARPAAALGLGRLERVAQPLVLDGLRERDRGRAARRERPQRRLVVLREPVCVRAAVERREHPEPAPAVDERREQRRPRVGDAELLGGDPQVRADVADPLHLARLEHLARRRALDRDADTGRARGHARAGGDDEVRSLAQQDHEAARLDERPAALGDELEHVLELHLRADRDGDRARGLQAPRRVLELVAARRDRFVQARVLDRDRRPRREDQDRLLVDGVEVAAGLLGEVEVAPDLPAHEHGNPEEARHRRVAGREAVGLRVLADGRDAQRPRIVDQHPEDAAPAREVADRAVRLGVDPAGDEALQLAPVTVEDPERGIARAGDLARGLEHLVEHGLEVELRQQAAADVDQASQPLLVEVVVHVDVGWRSPCESTPGRCPPRHFPRTGGSGMRTTRGRRAAPRGWRCTAPWP